MSRNVQLSVDRPASRLDMPATLEDHEVAQLEAYLDCVEQLLELPVARDGVPCSFKMQVRDGRVTLLESEVPSDDELAALLHRLRPLILSDEPASYHNIAGLLGRRFAHQYLRDLLKEQRRLFDGRNNQDLVRITANETVINCEQTLFDWLNGYEYHRDAAKREKIASLHRLVPLEHSMPILIGMLGDKVQAIAQLAGLIAVVLGREQSIQVVRHARSPVASTR
jgi:hypothetical protein